MEVKILKSVLSAEITVDMCLFCYELVYMLHIFACVTFIMTNTYLLGFYFAMPTHLCILFCMNSCVHKYGMGLLIELYNFRSSRNLTTSLVNMSNNGPQSNQRLGFRTQLTLDMSVFLDQRFVRTPYFYTYPLYYLFWFTLLEWNKNYTV
jgi:hypothetical protein